MQVKTLSYSCNLLLLGFIVYQHIILTTESSLEIDEGALIIVTSSEDKTDDCGQEYPLDLSIKKKTTDQNLFNEALPSTNLAASQISSPLYIYSPQFQISDFRINPTVFEKNDQGNYNGRAYIMNRHLKFFFTKKNIFDMAASDLSNKWVNNHILLPMQTLSITNYLLLNIKNDVVATMSVIFPFNFAKTFCLTHLRSIKDIEDFLVCLTNALKVSPIYITVNFELYYSLKEFSRISYCSYNGMHFCLTTLRLSRYIKKNINLFSLRGLLDTLICLTYKCKHMQKDLKSIIFTILFFYNHADKNLICNMEFILKDLMIRVILLVNIFEFIEDDDSKNERQKQEIYKKNIKEIERSFASAFYSRDLKKLMDSVYILRENILQSVIGYDFDFSFIVILLKSFKADHYLKAILY
ncbi:hypothetical protein NBO_1488g0001 [Nosema bombycis CQ1]|uniref:Uncharacterized protein n=1 Tax=Nosema bombycis (strain CQ1 / CVCC 102059) TaxID=578461 RepID=R0KM09_NOSB1|nr:hypothetical protein NBO_1488g0001 [Nosema bombycis CQ1]|eukprot:EOB11187.1 hypothetical protein NBO_1488g0001 [Nosema bombycis CQ1]